MDYMFLLLFLSKLFLQWFFTNKNTNITSTALKLCPDGGRNDFSYDVQRGHAKRDHNNASLSNLFIESVASG